MAIHIFQTGKGYDSKWGTFLLVAVLALVLIFSFGSGSGGSGRASNDIAIMEYRKTDKYVLQDWEYPPFFDRAHSFKGRGGYSAELRREFKKFSGQIAHPGPFRDSAQQLEERVWGIYADLLAKRNIALNEGTVYHMAEAVQLATESIYQTGDFADEWKTPIETWDVGGDCEDISMLKYWLLMRLGVPERNIRMLHIDGTDRDNRRDNVTHILVAVIATPTEWVALDNGAYFSHKSTTTIDWDAHEIKVFSTFNRLGNWKHHKRARPAYGVVTPDIVRQCEKGSLRRQYGLESEEECHGYILSQSPGNMSPRYTALWGDIGSTEEHFPMGRIGIAPPVRWGSEFEANDLSQIREMYSDRLREFQSARSQESIYTAERQKAIDVYDWMFGPETEKMLQAPLDTSAIEAEERACELVRSWMECRLAFQDRYLPQQNARTFIHNTLFFERLNSRACVAKSEDQHACILQAIRNVRAKIAEKPEMRPHMAIAEQRFRWYYETIGVPYDYKAGDPITLANLANFETASIPASLR